MTTSASAAPAEKTGRHQRSVKNYLIDARFQLKYAGLMVAVTLALSVVLGVFLWSTSNKVVDESKKVSDVVKMSIKDDPVYGDNPELAKAFNDSAGDSDQRVLAQQRAMMTGVVGGLGVLVVLIGLLGIYVTHKVAGPVYKMKMLLGQVGAGKLTFRGGLRKGDELQDFFEAFQSMVESLKARQEREVKELEEALAAVKAAGHHKCASCGAEQTENSSEDSLAKIVAVRDEMKRGLES